MSEFDLTEDQYEELMRLATLYRVEADRCEQAGAFLAGCVMIGAALEATLLGYAACYPDQLAASGVRPTTHDGSAKPLLDWTLYELLRLARDRRWLRVQVPAADGSHTEILDGVDDAHYVRQIRNLVHPGRYMADLQTEDLSKEDLEECHDMLAAITNYLAYQIGEELKSAITDASHEEGEA